MDITYRIDKDILYIAIDGRIDASNANAASEKIFSMKRDNPGKHTVIDADKLEYISSAGLRVLLIMHKACKGGVSLHGENEVVSEILSQTGFDSFFH